MKCVPKSEPSFEVDRERAFQGKLCSGFVLIDRSSVSVRLTAKIADHSSLLVAMSDVFETRDFVSRHFWHYADAN